MDKYDVTFSGNTPVIKTTGSAGADLVCAENTRIEPGQTVLVRLGTSVHIPEGCFGLLVPRSSIYKTNLIMANSVGIIDSDYRGELHCPLTNIGDKREDIAEGQALCQLVIAPFVPANYVQGTVCPESTERGVGGFGSTDGKKSSGDSTPVTENLGQSESSSEMENQSVSESSETSGSEISNPSEEQDSEGNDSFQDSLSALEESPTSESTEDSTLEDSGEEEDID